MSTQADQPIELFGVRLVGFTHENARKLLMTLALLAIVVGLSWFLRFIGKVVLKGHRSQKVVFWIRQGVHARQYTGRIVTISNAMVFDSPVYNFTRESGEDRHCVKHV